MKWFWKYVFPGVFGLAVYTTIRIVNDTTTGEKFWERKWQINAIEIILVVGYAYLFNKIVLYFVNRFNQHQRLPTGSDVLKEFATLSVVSFVAVNPLLFIVHYLIQSPVKWNDFAIANVVVILYVLLHYAIARGNSFIRAYIEQRLQMEKIKNDNLQTELKFLKAQYHPHFLFNALNTIYFQMDENIADAKKSIEKFSELLRYQLYDQQQTVPVSHELHYLENFIELQKVRSSDKLQLRVHFDSSLNSEQVYPLLFLPLVENAFKYVGGDYQINIEASKEANHLRFAVANSVPAETPWIKDQSRNGIGLENLKRRLELLYPGKHIFTTTKKDNTFFAEIQLQLS
ncbi:MAG: sensor histidine kinase [Niastella sp.]|jgi:two-component system LytT family sensor kinase|uniref:sensor histidine kinase n=1 Tax=Niastella sp. TaxID=1869183 RepID=UPI00389A1CC1